MMNTKKNIGFTLIELIVVLVLLGLVGFYCLYAYVDVVQTHINVDLNYQQLQKNESALLRIMLEIQSADDESVSAVDNVLSYTIDGNGRTLSQSGNNLILHKESDGTDHILVDRVQDFVVSISDRILSIYLTGLFSDNTSKLFSTSLYIREKGVI